MTTLSANRKPRRLDISCLALMTTTVGLEMTLRTRMHMTCMAIPQLKCSVSKSGNGSGKGASKDMCVYLSNNDRGKLQALTRIPVILFVFGYRKSIRHNSLPKVLFRLISHRSSK